MAERSGNVNAKMAAEMSEAITSVLIKLMPLPKATMILLHLKEEKESKKIAIMLGRVGGRIVCGFDVLFQFSG